MAVSPAEPPGHGAPATCQLLTGRRSKAVEQHLAAGPPRGPPRQRGEALTKNPVALCYSALSEFETFRAL